MNHPTIRVACLQLEARPYSQQAENKENIIQSIKTAAQSKPDLIILPECVYPCYFLSPRIIRSYTQLSSLTKIFLDEVKSYAYKYQTFIAIGIPEYSKEEDILFNSAFLIDKKGEEIGKARKSFLWHFDNKWFKSYDHYPVFDTEIGKIGIFICADGRVPEIARCLTLKGAEILLDLTNWVTSGLNTKTWTNPQIDYMIPTRALENKVWIVAANKVGFEEKSIQYCGKSAFFSPEGETIAIASTDKQEILIKDIDLAQSHVKNISGMVDVFMDRRPKYYSILAYPTSELPISRNFTQKRKEIEQNPLSAIIQIGETIHFQEYASKIESFFDTLREQEVNIFSFSQNNNIDIEQGQSIIALLRNLTRGKPELCSIALHELENDKKYKTFFLIESGKIIGTYRKTHLDSKEKNSVEPGKGQFEVFETQFGMIGMILDYEGYFPEITRILTLKGAEIILWSSQFSQDEQIKICQTRSAENKIFMICSNSIQQPCNGHSLITSPTGQIIAGCLENSEIASMTKISTSLSRDKTIVPHTDALLNRRPESYQELLCKRKR